jgi:hypothetical protein
MTDLYNWINPKTGNHSPMIAKTTYDIIMANEAVSLVPKIDRLSLLMIKAHTCNNTLYKNIVALSFIVG